MSEAHLLGNLVGRLLVSYGLVWVVIFLCSKLDWRLAFRRSRRWWGILVVTLVFLVGVFVNAARNGAM